MNKNVLKFNTTNRMPYMRHRKKMFAAAMCVVAASVVLIVRLCVLMVCQSEYYSKKASDLHERQRSIKAMRGQILDRNGIVLASSRTVCTVSVIHSQIEDAEGVIQMLVRELAIDEQTARKRVEKVSSIEKVKSNVDKETGDRIRNYNYPGVKVDEDYKRYYPYGSLASKVIGFTGADNQGILGIEAKYDEQLSGESGRILTVTDAWGIELDKYQEMRDEPDKGDNLVLSLDYNIQSYATQLADKTMLSCQAKSVSIIVMNPSDGEILAMVNTPEYDLNDPYSGETDMNILNARWRNFCINDTYEPGSIFKMVTAAAALETGVCTLNDHYSCGGRTVVADRTIRCHKTTGHGSQTFTETVMNSCNPAFIEWGRRVGVSSFYKYMGKLGLLSKTGIDIAGEASTIIHKQEKVGEVELATMSFGQSFQITPMQMIRAAAAIVNGGNLVTPHFAVKTVDNNNETVNEFTYSIQSDAIDKHTSDVMRDILGQVVEKGGGSKAYIEGFSIGGKTATSQKLPRGSGRYIASFIGFSSVDDPQIMAMCLIDEPVGAYYGGTIAAPVIRELFENVLPYTLK